MNQALKKSTQDAERTSVNQTQVIYKKSPSATFGILSVVFGALSVFILAPLFVPLGVLFGVLSLFKRSVVTVILGVIGLVLSVAGFLTSPILMGALGLGLMGR